MTLRTVTRPKPRNSVARLSSLVGHLIVFEVSTPGSSTGDLMQVPVLLLQEVKQGKDGKIVLTGLDTKKIVDCSRVHQAFRSYRTDRILSEVIDLGVVTSQYTLPHPDEEGFIEL